MNASRAAVALLTAVVLLAGCGTPARQAHQDGVAPATAVTASGPHNAFDVMFLQMMIGHQRQGLQMLQLGKQKAVREDVVNLAGAIDVTEAEEVQTMTRWLTAWNEPLVEVSDPAMHAAHGGRPATGADEIAALRAASGADFEMKFLNLLIAHQHNAVEMAQQLAVNGQNPTVKELAERIQLSRTQQIKQMLTLVSG